MNSPAGSNPLPRPARSVSLGRLVRNAGKLQLTRGISSAVAAIQIAVVARFLAPSDYGLYALVLTIVQCIQGIFDVRCSELVLRYYFQYRQKGESTPAGAVLLAGGLVELAIGTVAAGALVVFSAPLSAVFLGNYAQPHVFVAAALMPLGSIGSGLAASLLSIERHYGRLAFADSISTLVGFAVLVVVLPLHPSVPVLLGLGCFAQVARGILRWWYVWRAGGEAKTCLVTATSAPSSLRSLARDRRELLRFACANNFMALLKVLQGTVPNFMIGLLTGPVSVGYYYLGQRLSTRLGAFCSPILDVAFREFAEHRRDTNSNANEKQMRHAVLLIAGSVVPAILGVVVLGRWTIPLVFGSKYTGSVVPVQIVVATYTLGLLASPIGSLLLAEGRLSWLNLGFAIGTVTQFVLLGLLVTTHGATGAALAFAGFYVVMNGFTVYGFLKLRHAESRRPPAGPPEADGVCHAPATIATRS